MNIGDRIRFIRTSNKLNQADFADRIGIKQSPLSQIEHGKILPSLETLNEIRRVFNISLDWLITGIEEGENSAFKGSNSEIETNYKTNTKTNTKHNTITKKVGPEMGSNMGSNFQEYVFRTKEDPEVNRNHLEDLLNERDRVIDALNDVINTQKDLIKSQKSLIDVFRQRIEGIEDQTKNTG
ncbi:helix-turn-helix domain-containing protein [Sphingobacterium spiritivorum]|uniref:helix-turn-helix domain-containing protein n=1 Tax=Sphingobacterium spiritivorum TaxID=258 RepID=UPI003DA2DF44